MDNVIQFNNVWKKFKRGEKLNSIRDAVPNFFKQAIRKNNGLAAQEFWALHDVSFDIRKGEVVGILGPNGAGKSTVLKLLSRIMVPSKGSIAIQGRLSALIEVTAGFHPELTGRENAYLNGTILGMRKKEIDAKFEQIVEFSGVGEFIDTPVKRYSSGMYSRLGFSVAAHMDPDILLVDEVLSVGDIAFQAKCAEKMRELLRSGATIVLVSHNLSLVQSLCRRVILLNKGQLLKDGPTDEVLPYYENLVFKAQEEEFRNKIGSADTYKVSLNARQKVKIIDTIFLNNSGIKAGSFKVAEQITAKISYAAESLIAEPVFCLDIIRADGVLCCSLKNTDRGARIAGIEGKGEVTADLGRINLAPGIYLFKVSIWDKDLLHPFAVRNSDVLRIESESGRVETGAVFAPKVEWKA